MKDESISQQNQKLSITKNKCQLECFVNGDTLVPKEKSQTFIFNSQCVNAESFKQQLALISHSPLTSAPGLTTTILGRNFPSVPLEFALMQVMPTASCQGPSWLQSSKPAGTLGLGAT